MVQSKIELTPAQLADCFLAADGGYCWNCALNCLEELSKYIESDQVAMMKALMEEKYHLYYKDASKKTKGMLALEEL